MKNITDLQLEYLLSYFPINLIAREKCIVAVTTPIWKGGIGNFIRTKEVPDDFGCLEYTFDLESFLSSDFFKEQHEKNIQALKNTYEILGHKIKDLEKITL